MTEEPSTDEGRMGRSLLANALFSVLKAADAPVQASEALHRVEQSIDLTADERATSQSGRIRWQTFVRFVSSWATTVGWMTKKGGGWALTEAGLAALDSFEDPAEVYPALRKHYRDVVKSRKAAAGVDSRWAIVIEALELVDAGSWTAFQDLGDLLGTTGGNVGKFMFTTVVPNAHRVLGVDGRPAQDLEESANWSQMSNQVTVLESEGIRFVEGQAALDQRLTAADLKEMLGTDQDAPARRAWLLRGSNVNGANLVPTWLVKGSCSLAAAHLRTVDPPLSRREIAELVEQDYAHVSYNARNEKTIEFDSFLNRMQVGDVVISTSGPELYVGTVAGEAQFVKSRDDRSNLRRAVTWHNASAGIDFGELPATLKARLSSQHTLVDLTTDLASLERLIPTGEAETTAPEAVVEAVLRDATDELADELLVDRGWLDEVIDLLRDRRQVIFYGPPGTGKTYLAQAIAEHAASPESVKLVQFHPAYSYEDFFEGFRPTVGEGGAVGFALSPGPFRRIVDAARENPGTAYVLIVDEINRANLAKVFGELYFLLEYRDRSIDLLYSSGHEATFTLPRNVFIIGTMNTADRSIALVDAAMRRRFAFLPLHPAEPPTSDMLGRWLQRKHLPPTNAELLDSLNALIADDDLKIGPSYFMRGEVYKDGGLERLWRTAILPLLEEHHYGDGTNVEKEYSLKRLLNLDPPMRVVA